MGRKPKHARRIDDHSHISVTSLKRAGLAVDGEIHCGTLKLYRNDRLELSIACLVDLRAEALAVTLHYKACGKSHLYVIHLTSMKSNLGSGHFYYFHCPRTGMRCRKLYLDYNSGMFLHRSTLVGEIYHSQADSKKWKWYERNFGLLYKKQAAIDQLRQKNFKQTYGGTFTKRYLKLQKTIHPLKDKDTIGMSAEDAIKRMLRG